MDGNESLLHTLRGGRPDGDRLLVLIHGMGMYNTTWRPLLPHVEAEWPGRWIAPSLRGHGKSFAREPYGFGTQASDVAAVIADELCAHPASSIAVVGHSFGGIIGGMLATGWFGVDVDRLFSYSIKFTWPVNEIERFKAIAQKPARVTGRAEALERSLKYSGLAGLVPEDSEEAIDGIVEVGNAHYRPRMDPRAFGAMGPDIKAVFASVKIPYALSAGKDDPLVDLEDMRRVNPNAFLMPAGGHNSHVEFPAMAWKAFAAEILR